jgi:hypothetical protein
MNTEKVDHEQRLRHFQSINASNVTNTVNVLLTLTVGVAAFAVNILINAKGPLGLNAAMWLISSFVLLFGAALTGVTILFTRIEDYRRTIQAVVMARDNPGVVADQRLQQQADSIKKSADQLNRATNVLVYVQPSLFILGFVSLTISVLITNGAKLK